MALEKCQECGKEISTNALTCPNCGAWLPTDFIKKPVICGKCGKEFPLNRHRRRQKAKCPHCGELATTPEEDAEEKAWKYAEKLREENKSFLDKLFEDGCGCLLFIIAIAILVPWFFPLMHVLWLLLWQE